MQDISHHAYALEGTLDDALKILESHAVSVHGNPDVYCREFSDFTIDDARAVQTFASYSALGNSKYCILSFNSINVAAQNALLKVLEDAPGSTKFFLISMGVRKLIPTIRSRTIYIRSSAQMEEHASVKKFLNAQPAERLEIVEKMLLQAKKSESKSELLGLIEGLMRSRVLVGRPRTLRMLVKAHRQLSQQGASPKLILSNLAVGL